MQKIKVILLSIGLTFISAVTALTSTFAWFESVKHMNAGDTNRSVDAKSSSASLGDLDVYLNIDYDNSDFGKVALTDNNGQMWTVTKVHGQYVYSKIKTTTTDEFIPYGNLTFAASFMVDGHEATEQELAPYEGQSCTFTVEGGERTRISSSTDTVFSDDNEPIEVEVTLIDASEGTYSISPESLYFSLSGGNETGEIHEGDPCNISNIDNVSSATTLAKIIITGDESD